MIRIRQGTVVKVLSATQTMDELLVAVEGKEQRAINYHDVTGQARVGDPVVLNTTAVYKSLGTGGRHFVMANLNNQAMDAATKGHIMKLRYTPNQLQVLAVEEEDSPHAAVMRTADSLAGMPVVVATLHSMLPAIMAAIYKLGKGQLKVAYMMTDGAALPLAFSNLVRALKQKQLLHTTITCGHAFGGDYEAVNIYSGLLAARAVARADIAVVAMGPGIVGTGSKYGYTGLEQGQVINAVHTLQGRAVAVPRISFADPRERHHGLSHHTQTALAEVALVGCTVPIPQLARAKMQLLQAQLTAGGINNKHHVPVVDGEPALEMLAETGIKVTTMGRTVDEDRAFFLATGAAGLYATRLLTKPSIN